MIKQILKRLDNLTTYNVKIDPNDREFCILLEEKDTLGEWVKKEDIIDVINELEVEVNKLSKISSIRKPYTKEIIHYIDLPLGDALNFFVKEAARRDVSFSVIKSLGSDYYRMYIPGAKEIHIKEISNLINNELCLEKKTSM